MTLRARLPAGKTTGELTGAPGALQAARRGKGRANRRATSRRLLEVALLRRALGGERREERRCGAEAIDGLAIFPRKATGEGRFSRSPQDRLRLPHCLTPKC